MIFFNISFWLTSFLLGSQVIQKTMSAIVYFFNHIHQCIPKLFHHVLNFFLVPGFPQCVYALLPNSDFSTHVFSNIRRVRLNLFDLVHVSWDFLLKIRREPCPLLECYMSCGLVAPNLLFSVDFYGLWDVCHFSLWINQYFPRWDTTKSEHKRMADHVLNF